MFRFPTLLGLVLASVLLTLGGAAAEDPTADLRLEILELEDRRQSENGRLVELLAHSDAIIRTQAARALGRIQDPDTIDALATRVDDPDSGVREMIAFALGLMFERAAAPHLLPLLTDADAGVRSEAVLALGRAGDRNHAEELLALLEDEDRTVRGNVALACSLLRDQNTTLPLCKHFADEREASVRWRIVYALARLNDSRAEETLLDALDDTALPLIRLWAVRGLGEAARKQGVAERLLELRDDPDYRVVVTLLQLIAREPRAFAIDDVAPLVEHPSVHVRALLASAAARLGGAGASDLLERLRTDGSRTVQAAAIVGLARTLGRYAMPALGAATRDEDWRVRRAAIEGYGMIEGEVATKALLEGFADESPHVKMAAVAALAEREGDEAVRVLLEALDIEDLAVRGTAVEALLERKDEATLPALVRALRNWTGRETFELRESLARGLGELGDESSLDVLRECLEDDFASVRAAAADAIAQITGEPAPEVDRTPGDTDAADAPPPPTLVLDAPAEQVVVETTRGQIVLELFPDDAPRHVARFLQSVERKLYDGLTFHRVVPNFVVQGGDPLGNGWGDAGFSLRDEISPRSYLTGTLGMPKAGKDTGGCQLFITHAPQPHLDGRYTIFGTVKIGMDVVDALEVGDRIISIRRIGEER